MADPLDLITPVTSGMTFRDMRALAYSLADEVPDDAFPVTDVSRFLNQGINGSVPGRDVMSCEDRRDLDWQSLLKRRGVCSFLLV